MNNRILKFRMWNPETKVMVDLYKITPLAVHPDLLKENLDGLFIPFKENYPLMQFTGLKDKNGKEIYENDIVRHGLDDYPVFYENGAFCLKKDVWFSDNEAKNYVVIGNIYENPELLNVPSEKGE